jgi:cytidylate kinase
MSVAERLHYRYVDRDLIIEAAKLHHSNPAELARLDEIKPSLMRRGWYETHYHIEVLKSVVLEIGKADNVVIMGRGGQILFRGIKHALRVFVCAPIDFRVKRQMEDLASRVGHRVNVRPTQEAVRGWDLQRREWLSYLFAVDWQDPTLYDLTINSAAVSVEAAVELIVGAANQQERAPSEESQEAVEDRALAARVRCALAAHQDTRKYWTTVEADHGIVQLKGPSPLEKAVEVTRSVEGVVDVKTQPLTVFMIVPPFRV